VPLIGTQVLQQRYRVSGLLGQGGMGAVYRAWDARLSVPVALKEMVAQPGLDPHALSQLRQQFRQEATILARLQHPNLVRVTDFFEEDDNAYLVMSFVEGDSLASRIDREGALSEEPVLTWADQLLDALSYCHASGVIHRDVKPQNVILRPDGQAVLVDFGLVKLWNPHDPRTRTAMRGMGTPEYAPPEQYDAQSAHTDVRSDIYSVGATLYHSLTGRVPPTATQRIVNPSALEPVRSANPEVSAEIDAVLSRAMELQPSARYASAAAVREALHVHRTTGRAAAIAPDTAGRPPGAPPSDGASSGRFSAYGKLGIVLLVVGVLVIGALSAGAIWLFNERTTDTTPTTDAPTATVAGATDQRGTASPSRPPATVAATAEIPETGTSVVTPEPTDAPTVTALATATSFPTATPSPTVGATPTCPAVSGPFAALWQELKSRLGCSFNQPHTTLMAEQTFERGRMFWRDDRDSLYVLYDSGAWSAFPNDWRNGDPIYSCPATAPESSPPTPLRGFGRTWCSFSEVRDGLGWATDGERGYDGTAQDFASGSVFRNDFGVTFVLYGDGTWEQR
jgi:serine/threonine-protein kinase